MALLPHETTGGHDHVLAGTPAPRSRGSRESLEVDTGVTDLDSLRRRAFEQERCPCALRRRQEEVGPTENKQPVGPRARVAEGREERECLPDRDRELEAILGLPPGSIARVPVAELLRVDDVRSGERLVRTDVPVAGQSHREVSEPPTRQKGPQRASTRLCDVHASDVVRVPGREEHRDLEAVGQLFPHAYVPRSRVVTA